MRAHRQKVEERRIRQSQFKEAKEPWTLEQALELIRELAPDLEVVGWGIGLTGSLLKKGSSDRDADIILFPMSSDVAVLEDAREELRRHGLEMVYTAAEIHWFWRHGKNDSSDMKHVEVWVRDKHRIDVFFMR